MKKVKYMILGAMMTVLAAPAMAQDQVNPIQEQVTAIIKSGAADANKQISAIAKANKKDVNALVAIGKAYLAQKDYANAKTYAQQAVDLQAKSKAANAAPYLLMGNIAVGEDDGGAAAQWFQQAIYFDAKNPDGYRRYAQIMSKTDPAGAVQTLEDLRAQRPDYPVDLIAAEIYSEAGKMQKANEYYAKVSTDAMKDYQISDYATNLFLSQQYDKSLEVATKGHAKFPRNASFNRLMMFNNVEAKNFEAAIAAGDNLFNNSDSAKISTYDCGYFARACEGAKQFDKAISAYEKYGSLEGVKPEEKTQALKNISDCYKKMSNYAKAEEYLNKFIAAHSNTSFGLEETVAELYADQVSDETLPAAQRKAAYEKADGMYAELLKKYPEQAAYIANTRARMPFGFIADQMEALKLAGPHYVELCDALGAKADRSAGETKLLINAYNTATAYLVHVKNDMDAAKPLAEKLLQLDENNANAKAILGIQ